MGKSRVCGAICHKAKRAKCKCWCGGLFHGSAGREARDAFAREFSVEAVPTMQRTFDELTGQPDLFGDPAAGGRWRSAIEAAVAARTRPRKTAPGREVRDAAPF